MAIAEESVRPMHPMLPARTEAREAASAKAVTTASTSALPCRRDGATDPTQTPPLLSGGRRTWCLLDFGKRQRVHRTNAITRRLRPGRALRHERTRRVVNDQGDSDGNNGSLGRDTACRQTRRPSLKRWLCASAASPISAPPPGRTSSSSTLRSCSAAALGGGLASAIRSPRRERCRSSTGGDESSFPPCYPGPLRAGPASLDPESRLTRRQSVCGQDGPLLVFRAQWPDRGR